MDRYSEALALLNRVQELMAEEGDTLIGANLYTSMHLLEAAISRRTIMAQKPRDTD